MYFMTAENKDLVKKNEYVSKKVQGFKQYVMAKFDFIMQASFKLQNNAMVSSILLQYIR